MGRNLYLLLPTTGKLFDGLPRAKRYKVGTSLLIRSIVEVWYHVTGKSFELPMKFSSSISQLYPSNQLTRYLVSIWYGALSIF
jgi:hypothetical protein